jgi:integrase/recombinase XerC
MGIFYLDQFIDYLKFQKKYSLHTVIAYKKDITEFENYIFNEFEVDDIHAVSNDMVRSWVSQLIGVGMASVSVRRKISSLRSLYRYALKEKLISKNPLTALPQLKLSKKLPIVIENDSLNAILDGLADDADYQQNLDYIIICILFGTGIRRAELIGLKEDNVDLVQRQIKVLGKRNKERVIPITEELTAQMAKFIDIKRIHQLGMDYLLVNKKNKILYPMYIYNVVKKVLHLHKVHGKRSPHILRHTYATRLLQNGAELLSVKELLGHSSLASTQVYTHVNIEDLKKIYKKNHPKQ